MRVHMAARDTQAQLNGLRDPRQEIHSSHRQVADLLNMRPCTGVRLSGMSTAQRSPRAERVWVGGGGLQGRPRNISRKGLHLTGATTNIHTRSTPYLMRYGAQNTPAGSTNTPTIADADQVDALDKVMN